METSTATTQPASATVKLHPFERAGLGLAPFQVIGVEERRGPLTVQLRGADGLMHESQVGAHGQPMGTCDYCGTGIAECWTIRSADGKTFIVGCDCVRKTNDAKLAAQMAPGLRRLQREKRAAVAARKRAELDELLASPEAVAVLGAKPHPIGHLAARGETLLDSFLWMAKNAGDQGRRHTLKRAKAYLAGEV